MRAWLYSCLGFLGLIQAASAHQLNLSTIYLTVELPKVTADLGIYGTDAARMASRDLIDPGSGLVDPDKLDAAAAALARYFGQHLAIRGGNGAVCEQGPPLLGPDFESGLLAQIVFDCSKAEDGLVLTSTVMPTIDPAGRQAIVVSIGNEERQLPLLDAQHTEAMLTNAPPGAWEVAESYVGLGIEHVLTGYDHIAFILAMLLWARRPWPVVKIVTAFTLAHSTTLALATLGILEISPSIVEPLIAVTIVIAAAENFRSRAIDRKWLYALVLGLIHGFGFAGALKEVGLPGSAIPLSLATFNIGVEFGQLAIVAVAMPVLAALDRLIAAADAQPQRSATVVYAASAVIAALGLYWIVERTLWA
ncbi:MAG: HupE/UreJ family protein [Proteobacteria bacterium]|nr:HupE/UreJ family protein [Pseudomonadota bacterium]MBI3498924.1 HupE/UreJ family protein [Pseudomonadota bacterium]